ncbi:hypothetical protein [Pelagicoccus sp. SDUM812005]|uniref:hypothetical protein n=1 Tax=Pelagicoccus sp. SDUM812005 TaxID=3041257 RepID=UPI00280C91DE|nr:hypothetical protein [Pelagicoccus sp. SDUM812005]MDQ8181123.1 hypothetical protein [Pelagicoccus sp. SDUM812005]
MKASSSILTVHLAAIVVAQVAALAVLCYSELAEFRTSIEDELGISRDALWIIVGVAIVVFTLLIFRDLKRKVISPIEQIVQETKQGGSSFAFKKRSYTSEEDCLKHYLEGQSLRHAEMEQEVVRMEEEAAKARSVAEVSPEEFWGLREALSKARSRIEEYRKELDLRDKELARADDSLKVSESELRRISIELEELRKREQARLDGSHESLSIPRSRLNELQRSLSEICKESRHFKGEWANSTPTAVRDAFSTISARASEQWDALSVHLGIADSSAPSKVKVS